MEPNTQPTQSGERVSQGLDGVRQKAKENKQERFDKLFHRADGPAQWAKAKLVRYADDRAPRAQRAEEGPMCVTA